MQIYRLIYDITHQGLYSHPQANKSEIKVPTSINKYWNLVLEPKTSKTKLYLDGITIHA